MLEIFVYSDYVCPFCFFGEIELNKALEGLEEKVEVQWMPYELRPHPTPQLRPEGQYLQEQWSEQVYPAARRLGIKAVLPKISPQPRTDLAFAGYQYALEEDKAEEYNARLFRAYFQEEQNIGDEEVLVKLATEIGLNGNAYRQAIKSKKYKRAHQEALAHAYEDVQIQDVPTFIIGDEMVEGLLVSEDLREIIVKKLEEVEEE
ncbi:MAG: 2-hydroxychromene-2-carboxylate isomerase [Sphingobacteriales bacterium]|nr:MAG: 2-hydroxychromene-2-carboxylate isomerase [Sphingobacteriales bacterium]